MKYSKVTLGQSEAVFNKLGGEQGITDFLSGRTQVVKSDRNFPTLMNIEVGLYDSNELIKIIRKDKKINTHESNNILEWPPLFEFYERKNLELVVVTPADLGFEPMFESCATYDNICERAEIVGLDKCPPELGMLLSLPQYGLKDGFYIIASKLLRDEDKKKHLLVVWYGKNDTCELKAWEDKNEPYFKDFKFIFVRRNVVLEG